METKVQIKPQGNDLKKLRELRSENRRFKRELTETKSALDRCRQDALVLTRHVVMLENVVLPLLKLHYGDKVKVDFHKFELCVDQRCIKFDEYEEFLTALRILPLFVQ